MKEKIIINKIKWVMLLGSMLGVMIWTFTSCSALRNYTPPKDGVIYSGGTLLIVRSGNQNIIIKKSMFDYGHQIIIKK